MKPEEVKLGDWVRMFFGQVPPEFYLELVIRAVLVYALLMVSMRLLGKRMATQMSRLEMAAMVALASAIGVPMLDPARGILPTFIIGLVVVAVTRIISGISYKSQQFEQVTQGHIDLLVKDAVMDLKLMQKTRITRERLFAQLRSENLHHLGLVKRLYLEANGHFSLIRETKEKPGLMVLPEWDKDFIAQTLRPTDTLVCNNCGSEQPKEATLRKEMPCPACGATDWTKGVVQRQSGL